MKAFPPQRTEEEPVSFLRSPLNVLLILAGLIIVSVAVNGYTSYRSDHLSQIPLIFIQSNPDLFPKDWFFQNFGHFKLRFLHLVLIKSLAWAVGIPASLAVIYALCIASAMAAWLAIARHVYGSVLPGIVTCLFAIIFYGEVGANHLIERILIPRTEAFAVIYWGVFLLITGRAAAAGLLFGVASCFQPAVGFQFAIPMFFWMWIAGVPNRLRDSLLFLGCFAAVFAPWAAFLGSSFTGGSNLTDREIINLVAWIRHPPLMIPRFFGRTVWADFMFLLFGAGWAWRLMSRGNERARRIGWLVPIMAVLLFLATVFIEFIPVKGVVLFQPFRASVLLYFVVFLMLGPYVLDLLQSANPFRRFRGVFLMFSVYVLPLLGAVAMLEVFFAWRERQGRSEPRLEAALIAGLALVGGYFIRPEVGGRATTWAILGGAVAATVLLHVLTARRAWERPVALRNTLAAFAVAGYTLIAAFFWMPWDRWLDAEDAGTRTRAAQVAWRYQINPVPIKAIERLGVWARDNTPEDALFIIPPERSAEGFGIWSLRSIVYNVKLFPVTQGAYEEWRNRYFAHCGILDPNDPKEADRVRDALTDYGTKRISDKFSRMTEDEMLALADRYEANYVITPTVYKGERFKLLHSDFDRLRPTRDGYELFVYQISGG